jgi:hypothetical protein
MVGGGVDVEHEIRSDGDDGGAAEVAGFVGVVEDENGEPGLLGEAAELEEDREDHREAVDGGAAQQAGQAIDDEETSADLAGGVEDGLGIGRLGQIVAGVGGEVDGGVGGGVVAGEDGVEAAVELGQASFFIDVKDGRLLGLAAEPVGAEGGADGKIEGEVGLFGAGRADEDGETGARQQAADGPLERRRRLEGVLGGIDGAMVLKAGLYGDGNVSPFGKMERGS